MSSYTPGPWEYNDRTWDIEHRSDTLYGIVAKYVHQCNAPIIVAAPDMVKLLYRVHEELAGILEDNDLYPYDEMAASDICREIEAILQRIDDTE